jgi:hypothetical protein
MTEHDGDAAGGADADVINDTTSEASSEVTSGGRTETASRWRAEVLAFAELFALSGIAIAQPLLDLISKNTGMLIANRANGLQAVLLVALILVVVPLAMWLVEFAVGLVAARARRWVHAGLCGVLVTALAMEVVKKQTSLGSAAIIRIAILCGVIGAALVLLFAIVRQFLHYLSIAPVIFAALFLFASPATEVVFTSSQAAATDVGVDNPKRIVMVVLDELPEMSLLDGQGRVDPELFPNFARIAGDATWYRNNTTVAPYTNLAVPAMLTGQYPKNAEQVPTVSDYPDNLFTLLGKAYGMNVHETVTQLCPSRVCKGGGTGGFTSLVEQSARLWKEYAAPTRSKFSFADDVGVSKALPTMTDFVDSLAPTSAPRLDYVHIVFPHNPWHYLPTLQDTLNVSQMKGAELLAWANQPLADQAKQRHVLQVQAADTLLGRVLDKLERIGAYDDSLVIVTADHGVSFVAGEALRSVTPKNYPQIMWTPMFVKYPGQSEGKIDDRPAQSVDLLPTVADVVDVDIPFDVDGRSLRGEVRPVDPLPFYQWKGVDTIGLAGAPVAPAGEHLEFDGASGFAEVRTAEAAPAGDDPALRVYRSGEHGDLVGRPAAPLVRDEPNLADGPTVVLGTAETLENVRLKARKVPWAFHSGGVRNANGDIDVAFVIDGRIVAVTKAVAAKEGAKDSYLTFVMPPSLVHQGRNDVTAYVIRGTSDAPTLDPVPYEAA